MPPALNTHDLRRSQAATPDRRRHQRATPSPSGSAAS
jgi:hypothetical protein